MLNGVGPSFRFDGRVTVITGGSGGLATVVAQGLLQQGSEIALVDMNIERTELAALALIQWGQEHMKEEVPKVSAWACDVSSAESVDTAFAAINEAHGKLADLLVNTAGYCENFPAHEYPASNAERLVKVNLLGSLYTLQALARPLIAAGQRGGSIVLIGSMSGSIVNNPQPQVAYNMSKAGVIHLAKTLALEWATFGIRVNTLSPGYILTALTRNVIAASETMKNEWESRIPMKRMLEPSEFVGSCLYLLSNTLSSYTTGHDLVVDGGYGIW